jgi:CHAT domain-containing protein
MIGLDIVMIWHSARRWMALMALAGSLAAVTAASAQSPVPMEFPPPGTRWINRSTDHNGGIHLATYTVLEPGSFQGRAAFRVSDALGVQFFERAGRNWFATVLREKERAGSTPHTGTFAWPLEVGKSWVSVYQYRDNQRNFRFNNITTTWRVAAEEELTVPAGRYKTLRLEGSNNGNTWVTWYAPSLRLVVKEIHERKPGHPAGPGRTVGEIVRYAGPGGDPWFGFGLEASQASIRRGDGRRAIAFYEDTAKDFEARGMPVEAAHALVDLARIARPVGAAQQGLRAGLRAVELLKTAPRNDFVLGDLSNAHLFVGYIYRGVASLAEAQQFFQEGLRLSGAFSTPQRRLFWSGVFARSLADLALSRHDYPAGAQQAADAVKQFEQFLANQSASGFDQGRRNAQRNLVLALGAVGDAERHMGNHAAATQALDRGVRVARDLGATELELGGWNSLGYIALVRRDFPEAIRNFDEVKRIATATGNPYYLMWAHNGVGRARFQEGRYPEALDAYKQAVAVAETLRGSLQDAALRSGFLEDKQEMYHGAVWSAVALRKPEEAWSIAESARSRAFLDLLGTQTVLSKGKTRALVDEEVRLRGRLGATKAAAEEASEDDAADARADSEAAERAYREFLDRVRKENAEQASLMTVEPVNVKELQALLPDGTTLVEYLVSRNGTFAWVINRTSVTVVRLHIQRDQVVAAVRAFRRGIEGQAPLPDAQKLAEALHEQLLAPVRQHIRGSRVIVVPHDVLHYLPFGALRSKQGRWLVEDYTLSTLPSASVLKFLEAKRSAGGGGVLAVGNPDLGSALNLRFAEREARVVAHHYAGASVLVRGDATEDRAKSLANGARLLHFATHGELNENDPLASGLLLAPGGKDDGRLEVREIFGLDLSAQLVVLSACETGLGKLSTGDELIGLQRAFLYAGTPAVVTTLWKVDDRASFVLMREFYDRLAKADTGLALQGAQRAAMKEFPHPYAWAAFGLTGAGR